jgi:hypothetical protein
VTQSQGGGRVSILLGIAALILLASLVGGYNHYQAYIEATASGLPILGSASFVRNLLVLGASGAAALTTWVLALRNEIAIAYLAGAIAVAALALGEATSLVQNIWQTSSFSLMFHLPNILGTILLSLLAGVFALKWRKR